MPDPATQTLDPSLSAGTLTFLLTDIAGSTRLWEEHGLEMGKALARHDAIARQAVEQAGGVLVKGTGDGCMAVFDSPQSAVRAVIELQRRLAREDWRPVKALTARAALYSGEAEWREGDYYGRAVNRAARLRDAAHGGQVLLDADTAANVSDALPEDAFLSDLGRHRFRDLSAPEHVFQLCHPDLLCGFEPIRSLEVTRHNLPVQTTSFVGREGQLGQLRHLIRTSRQVTLTGPGGAGKTRLAVQAAAELAGDFADGVWLVELDSLTNDTLVPQRVAVAMRIPEPRGADVVAAIVDALRGETRLLILDNCEHLLDACSVLVDELVERCPGLRVLATSREPLGNPGERVFPVPALPVPRSAGASAISVEEASRSPAVRLFVERAACALPGFDLTPRNAADVAALCARLEGLPLALELAAPWVRLLSPAQICERLGDALQILSRGSRTVHPRQRTMRGVIDWSHQLLSDRERSLFRRLAAFAGGWTLDAAEAVCAFQPLEGGILGVTMLSLCEKSLLQADEGHAGEWRYRFLEPIRQYAVERLRESGEEPTVRERHRDHFLRLAEEADERLQGPEQAECLQLLEAEHSNLRAALETSLRAGDAQEALLLCRALWWFWFIHGHITEGRHWIARTLATALHQGTPPLDGVLSGAGNLAWAQGDLEAARTFHESCLERRRAAGDLRGIAGSLSNLGTVAAAENRLDDARDYFEESVAYYREIGEERNQARLLSNLGALLLQRNEPELAVGVLEESLALHRRFQEPSGIAAVLTNLGAAYRDSSQFERARSTLLEALAIRRSLDDARGMAIVLEPWASLMLDLGRPAEALQAMHASALLRQSVDVRGHAFQAEREERMERFRALVSPEEAARLREEVAGLDAGRIVEGILGSGLA